MNEAFNNWFEAQDIPFKKYFRPDELLFRGNSHFDISHPGYLKNLQPPEHLWDNILPAFTALCALREHIGVPIHLLSAYRCEVYNTAIGGASKSQHLSFSALDPKAQGVSAFECHKQLQARQADGRFVGGLGQYDTFWHMDGRGHNANWDKRASQK